MPTQEELEGQIETALAAQSLPASITTSVLAAIAAAGYDLVPQEGGDPVQALGSVAATRRAVAGMPGHFLVEIDAGEDVVLRYVEIHGKGGDVRRLAMPG